MGTTASANSNTSKTSRRFHEDDDSNEKIDRFVISSWKQKLRDQEGEIKILKRVIDRERTIVKTKEAEIEKLKAEINKVKSVLDAKFNTSISTKSSSDSTSEPRNKKLGVSGESSQSSLQQNDFTIFDKDIRYFFLGFIFWSKSFSTGIFS